MKIKKVFFEEHAMGTTQRSLRVLRDELAHRYTHKICVIEVPTDELCCGFLILDEDDSSATFTGNGFRTDNGGEGGAGYRSAEALFSLFHVRLIHWEPVDLSPITDHINDLYFRHQSPGLALPTLDILQPIADQIDPSEFQELFKLEPEYVRR